MKIGILTFHNAHNYGAVLQAYALRTKLRMLGHETHILNYRNEKIEKAYEKKLVAKNVPVSLFHPKTIVRNFSNKLDAVYAQKDWKRRCCVFDDFINTVLLENRKETLDAKQLELLEIDVFICGSDQIWTDYLTGGYDKCYFLDFPSVAKKIAYGASRVNAEFDDAEERFFCEKLADFDALSVREDTLAKALTSICHKYVNTVLDPSLLISAEEYQAIASKRIEDAEYILAYYLVEDEALRTCAERAAEQLHVNLVEIHYYKQRGRKCKQVADCGPSDFMSYIQHAKYVFTNSFHGVAFSIIYQKNFYAVYIKDSRKDNLLRVLGLEERHIRTVDEMKIETLVEYEDPLKRLAIERKKSEDFLKSSLM